MRERMSETDLLTWLFIHPSETHNLMALEAPFYPTITWER